MNMIPTRTRLEVVGAAFIIFVIGMAGYIVYDHFADRPAGSVSTIARIAPAVAKQPTVLATIQAPVKTFRGNSKKNAQLPAAVIADDNTQVIAASQTPASLRPTTTTTTANLTTGEITTYTKTDPYPWLAWEPRGEIKLAHGFKYNHVMHNSAQVSRLQLSYDMVRVKALTVGVTGTVDSDSTAFAGVAISYKW